MLHIADETSVLDLLIIGCGPAGLFLAAESAKKGLIFGLVGPILPFTNNYDRRTNSRVSHHSQLWNAASCLDNISTSMIFKRWYLFLFLFPSSRPGELYLYSNAYWIERCTLRNMITAIFSTGSHHDHNAEASTEVKVCFISLICAILWLCLSGNIVSNQMPLSWLAAAVFWMQ